METQALNFLFMGLIDRWTKKATTSAIDTTKESLNEKLETYSGIIKVGLTLAVIVFGGKAINKHSVKSEPRSYSQPPIIINNYYDRRYVPNAKRQRQQQNAKEHQNWR